MCTSAALSKRSAGWCSCFCENGTSVSEFLGLDALSIERSGNKRNSQDTCQAEAESRQRTALNQGESVDGFASLTLFKVTPTDRKRGYQLP